MQHAEHNAKPKGHLKRPAPHTKTKEIKTRTKKDQLIGLLSKPKGARVSSLCKTLGWQTHTVRAALSGLRKQGMTIETSRSAKDGEAVYTLRTKPEGVTRS